MAKEYDLTDVAREMATRLGKAPTEMREAVNCFFEVVADALASEKRVEVHNCGTFHLTKRLPHPGWNFQTETLITVPEHYRITFNAMPHIEDMVEANLGDGLRVY